MNKYNFKSGAIFIQLTAPRFSHTQFFMAWFFHGLANPSIGSGNIDIAIIPFQVRDGSFSREVLLLALWDSRVKRRLSNAFISMSCKVARIVWIIAALGMMPAPCAIAQESFKIDGLELVWVAPGSFTEGVEGDLKNPSRFTRVEAGYWISSTEITQKLYEAITQTNPSVQKGETHPVENVSWHDAMAFAERLTEHGRTLPHFPEGYIFRLPTATEWEYAARGGNKGSRDIYAGGDKLQEVGWGRGESPHAHQPVKGKRPNVLGLYDMTGNVWEWCLDALPIDLTGKPTEITRIKRGGSFNNNGATSYVTNYGEMDPLQKGQRFGFRLILAKPIPDSP